MLPIIKQNVPTIAGKIPPPVIPSFGFEVRNSQFMTEIPLTMIKARMINNTATTMKLITRKMEKATNSDIFLDFMGYAFLDLDLIMSTARFIPNVMMNKTMPRANNALK